MLRLCCAVVLLLTAGCSSLANGPAPGRLADVPSTSAPLDRVAWQARHLLEAGRDRAALDLATEVLAEAPDHVDAHRVRQDVLRRRGRLGLLLHEAEVRLAERPDSALAHYLSGRIAPTDAEKLARFERAVELAPQSFWGWLGVAYALQTTDPEESLAIYRRIYQGSEGHPIAAIALGAALRAFDAQFAAGAGTGERRQLDEALAVYFGLRGHPLVPGVGDLGIAQTYFQREKPKEAWPALMTALAQRPFDPGVQALVQQYVERGLPRDQLHQIIDTLQQDASRLQQFATGNGAGVLAAVFSSGGMPLAAREALERAAGGRADPQLEREERRLLLRSGDVAGFLDRLRSTFPDWLLADEANQVRGRWLRLLSGPWMTAPDPLAAPEDAAELIEAALRAGLLEEAEAVGTVALLRHGDGDRRRLHELVAEARREIAFERALRRVLYRGYGGDSDADLGALLEQLRRISADTLDEDVIGEPTRFHIPFIGDLVDPFGPGLCAHLARYNRHLVLGQRDGHPVEGLLLTRLSLRELDPSDDVPLDAPAWEVIGEDRMIRSLTGIYGGDLAGVALVNHYVVDMDSVREWANDIRERREIIEQDRGAALDDPLPQEIELLEPASVHWRLSALAPAPDEELEAAVLEMIRWHERAHLADTLHYLPVENNLWRVLGLLIGHGFSRESIEAEMEARAEAAALALSEHTRLVLAHIAVFLEGDAAATPHSSGFRRLARQLAGALEAAGQPGEASRWHEVDPEVARRIGLEMLRQHR